MPQRFPRLDQSPVHLPQLPATASDRWDLLLDLAGQVNVPWTLVGGQMVMLHGLQLARPSPRLSADIDTAIDVRAEPAALPTIITTFRGLGLQPASEPTPDGIMHRYARPGTTATVDLITTTSVDVLVPEGLGPRTQVTGPHGRAFAAPGTTQALQRTELLPTAYGNKTADIPRPNLLGSQPPRSCRVSACRRRCRSGRPPSR